MLDYRCEKETAVFSSIFTNPFKELPQAFELHGFGEFKAPPSYYTRRRDYDQCLLFYTISGEGCLEYHQQTYHLGAGSIAVINCRDPQYYYTNSELWHFLWFHFDGQTSFPLVDYINVTDSSSAIGRKSDSFTSLTGSKAWRRRPKSIRRWKYR